MSEEKLTPWYADLSTQDLLAIFAEEMRMPGVKPDDPHIVQMRDELARLNGGPRKTLSGSTNDPPLQPCNHGDERKIG